MKSAKPVPAECVAALCPSCALCCNGVLFADVRLARGDNTGKLEQFGVRLIQKTSSFAQPCPCLDGTHCRAYSDRPKRCRQFECGVLKRFAGNELTRKSAVALICRAQEKVRHIQSLLRELGDSDEHLPLTRRYAHVMAQPMDLGGDARILKRRGDLLKVFDGLMQLLHREFLSTGGETR